MILRSIRVEGPIAYVPLTRGYEAIIDADSVPLVEGHNWSAKPCGGVVYACRKGRAGTDEKRSVLMHRVILPVDSDVDHVDCCGLNNRKNNLRPATFAQNRRNVRVHRDSKSGVKGVWWHRAVNKWVSAIKTDGRTIHLGCFSTLKEAGDAYAAAAEKFHGEFART